jgi:hypothetical protein
MDRIRLAADVVGKEKINSLLDVGCRGGALRAFLRPEIDYFGCDLVKGDHVHYVGDIQAISIDRQFDCVVALDILEHVDQLHSLFDRLANLATKLLVVSLPNCYDLKSRVLFGLRGRLSGKYEFRPEYAIDRHRWLMSYSEVYRFYTAKAQEHGLELKCVDCRYGDVSRITVAGVAGLALRVLGENLTTETVVGVFRRVDKASYER